MNDSILYRLQIEEEAIKANKRVQLFEAKQRIRREKAAKQKRDARLKMSVKKLAVFREKDRVRKQIQRKRDALSIKKKRDSMPQIEKDKLLAKQREHYALRKKKKKVDKEKQIQTKNNSSFTAGNSRSIPVLNIAPNTNEFAPNTNKISSKNVVMVYDAISFPLCDQILPLCHNGKEISHAKSVDLNDKANGVRSGQSKVEGLKFDYSQQMPTDNDDKGWEKVFRQSTSSVPIKINTRNNEVIELEWLSENQPVVSTITTAVPYFIDNHTPVRQTEGKVGIMTSAGKRVEIRVGAVTDYRPRIRNEESNEKLSEQHLQDSGIDFHLLLLKSSLGKKYMEVLDQLIITGNVRTVIQDEQTYYLLPSYAFSWNLTNQIHLDGNDYTRSYALFYPSEERSGGRTWLLFSDYKIAIECASPVLISWNGSKEKHCSCTDNSMEAGHIYSFFAASWMTVQRYINIERAFGSVIRSEIEVGGLVYVRCRKKDLKKNGLQMYDCGTSNNYCTYLKAIVRTIVPNISGRKQVFVVFVASASRLGPIQFDMNDVCNVTDVATVKYLSKV